MTLYVKRPESGEPARTEAAVFRFGEPLDDLLKVAQQADPDAAVVEVPAWRVLLVRYWIVPDNGPSYIDYEVLEDGQVLVWSHHHYVLYVTDAADFEREWTPEVDRGQ